MTSPGGSRVLVELLTGTADRASNPFAPDRSFAEREHDIL
jgi:hypothetical protein